MKENFCPISHEPPKDFFSYFKFYGRMFFDFQTLTIFRHLKAILPFYTGKVLDIGCGNSPFRFLIHPSQAEYLGVDIKAASNFGYQNQAKIEFDGENLPFLDGSIENIIFTEVLEHLENPENLIAEMYRVLKAGGKAVVTIPFSARVHYIPNDYCRYTPYKLQKLFSAFSEIEILNRGTDINSIIAKLIVMCFGLIIPLYFGQNKAALEQERKLSLSFYSYLSRFLLFIIILPFVLLITVIGHLELLFKLGSDNDPLGYTIILKK
ncbi:MAG: class I SAM-dependent methyltransferase [Deltaproteobacteria bacterium]|jgi:SAM-dependent methyltransferase|nr:class I SAM-dependent methyltransferase [Deltaproteobacteria bacterium]